MLTKQHHPATEKDIEHYFNHRSNQFSYSIDALQWQSQHNQYKRFEVIYNHVCPSSETLCDVGCGYGDFYNFLKIQQSTINYTGIDLSANMIVGAQRTYPTGRFKCMNLKTLSKRYKFDSIVASGTFNIEMKDHETYLKNQIQYMCLAAKKQILFNLLTKKSKLNIKKSNITYVTKDTIKNTLNSLHLSYEIIDNYLHNDLTIHISL